MSTPTFTIPRAALAKELSLLQSVAETKGTIPVLSFALFEVANNRARITASDMAITMTTEIECDGSDYRGCIPLKQLTALVRLFGDEEAIQFTVKANSRIEVRWGKSKHLLVTLPADEFPSSEIPTGAEVSIDAVQLLSMLERTAFCAGQPGEGLQFAFECISLEVAGKELTLAATNSRQFGATTCAIDSEAEFTALVPIRSVPALVKLCEGEGAVTITADDNHALFQCGTRALTTRLVAGIFPNWRLAMPVSLDHQLTIDPERLALSLKRACVTTREAKMIRMPLSLSFTQSLLQITSSSEDGESSDEVAINCATLNGDALPIRVNAENILNFVSHTEGQVRVQFSNEARLLQLGIEGDESYRYITMALR